MGDGNLRRNKKQQLHISMEQLKMTITNRRAAGANWNAHQRIESKEAPSNDENDGSNDNVPEGNDENGNAQPLAEVSKAARKRQKRKTNQSNKFVSIDCEMVGVGFNGQGDMLARVSVVNKRGDVLLDKFVKPCKEVTDYRTSVSGIRPSDIEHGEEFDSVQDKVIELLQGKTLIGHAISKDLAVLGIKHPFSLIRDTSRYKPLCRLVSNGHTPSLKRLARVILGQEIQIGEHNSVEDARAAMSIYNCLSTDWEQYLEKSKRK